MNTIEKIIDLVLKCSSLDKSEKEELVGKIEYLAEWQLEKLYINLIDLKQKEEKFVSDSKRIDLKYKREVQNEIEKINVSE